MKRIVLLMLFCTIVTLLGVGCVPEKPVKDGKGELAVVIDREFGTPATHSPLDWWQTRHPDVVNAGDIIEKDCLYCHAVDKSCNNCHGYVGVRKIKSPVD